MTCITDRCSSAGDCTRHVSLLLASSGGAGPRRAAGADAALLALADELRALRSGSPRRELLACADHLAQRFTVDLGGRPATLAPDTVLTHGAGAPLVLGAIAVTAAREAGIALGLLAGPRGSYAVAHATLAEPLVLDIAGGFARRDVAGAESLHRWLCAHETAQRVAELRTATQRRTAAGTPAPRVPAHARPA